MKKLLTTIALSIIMVTLTNAQIKKPTVRVGVTKTKTQQPSSGLLLKSSVKLKTLQDLNKLNIPVSQITKEKLNAKPTRSWEITPLKIRNGDLKLDSFKGDYDIDFWAWGLSAGSNRNFEQIIDEIENGEPEDLYNNIFPFTIKFRAAGGVEYRLKIKQTIVDLDRNSHYLYIKNGNRISKIQMDGLDFNYVFKEGRSREIEISFSGATLIDINYSGGGVWWPIKTQKIQIDRIN